MRFILFLLVFHSICMPRSIHRKHDPETPIIKISYIDNNPIDTSILRSFYLRKFPIFKTFNKEYFYKNYLPNQIDVKNKIINSEDISKQIEALLQEISQNKTKYTDFKILKKSFNKFRQNGFLVLKFKDLPLVLKLFIETPYSLTHPYEKVFEERGIFTMGGSSRYFLGFTRIPNRELIQCNLNTNEISMPRKWYWLPSNAKWLNIEGYNIGKKPYRQITTPAIYALICEEVIGNNKNTKDAKIKYLNLCTSSEYIIDPHPINFKINNGQLIILDTEHFPTLFGAHKKIKPCKKFSSWYVKVGGIYLRSGFLTSKKARKNNQLQKNYYKLYTS